MTNPTTCEVCGKSDYQISGVCSSGLGPVSIAICGICLGMGAEPMFVCKAVLSKHPGKTIDSITYDAASDCYVSYKTGVVIPIKTKKKGTHQTRGAFIQAIADE